MSSTDTRWSADGQTIPEIEPHTKTKHLLIEQYATNLIYTLYGTGKHGVKSFTFIDGFCGGGIYKDQDLKNTWYGSPIRLINAVREGYLKSKRTYPLNVKFIFVDKNKQHLECLQNVAMTQAELGQLSDENVHTFKTELGERVEQCEFICDEFENQVNYCVIQSDHRKGHSLFFLDPYGYLQVSMESFRKINKLKRSEIVYTFMSRDMQRFVIEKRGKERENFYKKFEADGYFNNLETLQGFGREAKMRDELMRLFRNKGNANKILTFAMMSTNSSRVLYYLVHICSHLRALEVMKDGSWTFNNLNYQYHYDIYGYGFKTAIYYEENQFDLKLDINPDSETTCLNKLSRYIDNLINKNPDGIPFINLCEQTMELNPATRKHYCGYLKFLQDAEEIEVFRDGKKINLTEKTELRNSDIIRKLQTRKLFDLKPIIQRL